MSAPAPSSQHAAAIAQLAQDAATAEAVSALEEEGMRAILLKGAAIAARLYDDPVQRPYGDGDLLVDPARYDDAARTLQRLGYSDPLAAVPTAQARHASTWHRGSVTVDLHRTLPLSGSDPATTWAVLSAGTTIAGVGGRDVEALSDPALALTITAHVVQHGPVLKPRADLERALQRFGPEVWRRARELAAGLSMDEVLGAGLREIGLGVALARELGLPTSTSPDVDLHLAGRRETVGGFVRLSELRSPRERLRFLVVKLVPPPSFMRFWWPFARRGRRALVLSYVWRLVWLVRNAPGGYLHWRAAQRGSVPPRRRLLPRRRVTAADLRAALWTWRAGRRVRRQLRDGGLESVSLPRVPRVDDAAVRGVGAVLARRPLSCLERSLVRQRWHAAHGRPRELVIGVRNPGEDFGAHAWLEGDPPTEAEGFTALLRHPA